MFTGIVQAALPVHAIIRKPQLHTLTLRFPPELGAGLRLGASVAVNGVCLTVARLGADGAVDFDVMMESLRITNLGGLEEGARVNVERAARFGDEIGGHPLSGHISDTVAITAIEAPQNNRVLTFRAAPRWMKYILPKGYVALNGCSLTVGQVGDDWFNVYLIPETLRITTFGEARVGDRVNLELDSQTQAIVDTVERVLAQRGLG
ncbi:MAG TPA: riboflavin synthase subunit alpha [Candidatus Competibacteraceae bacterium]|nr:riboflavin synthase subunit alpha [Candidatus Competibacteraceae bacterium]